MNRVFLLVLILWIVPIKSQQTKATPKEAVCIAGSHLEKGNNMAYHLATIADYLQTQNYKVHRFYDPNNDWDAIKKASLNASLIIYQGHGTNLGIDHGFGGMVVKEFVSGKEIASELKFNLNPLVIYMSACGGAGSSAGDVTDIGVEVAKKRVLGSALPFLLAGARGYYATNYYTEILSFVKKWINHKTLNACYLESTSPWCTIVSNAPVEDPRINPGYMHAISATEDRHVYSMPTTKKGKTSAKLLCRYNTYDIAYLGDPMLTVDQTLKKKSLYVALKDR